MPQTPPAGASTVKTRILILSDTHDGAPWGSLDVPNASSLPKADVLLHCGDLTMIGKLDEYEKAIEMLGSIDAGLKLVIAGNHDISLDEEFFERRGAHMQRLQEPDPTIPEKAKEMWTGDLAKQAGVTYLEEGTHAFTLSNGAKLRVYASPYTPFFCDFAFPYHSHEDRYNPSRACTPGATPIATNPVPDFPAVDIMMTHGPPYGIRDETRTGSVGCEHLLRAGRRARPRIHCFGHIHEGWGAERVRWADGDEVDVQPEQKIKSREWIEVGDGEEQGVAMVDVSIEGGKELEWGRETLMVNASVMTLGYRARNKPWLVDLDLERADGNEELNPATASQA